MAEAVLRLLMKNLDTLIQQGFGLLWGVKKDMERLSMMLSAIRDVLEDAEMKQITYEPIANWLDNLKQAAYDADDALDEWYTDARPAEALEGANYGISKKVCESVSSSLSLKQIAFRLNVGKKLKKIISTFNEIAAVKDKFFLSQNVVSDRVQIEETSSILVEEVVYGRDGDREKVIDILLNNVNRQENVSVLPIQGMGGLGKTTLAQLVFNDDRVVKHFDARMWVCVSDDFDVKRLTRMIIDAYSGQTCDLKDLDPMQRQLQEKLSGKKFLLVLDDIWNEDSDKWERLKSSLTCGVKGSWVIVTTRLIKVTSIVGTVPSHELTFLSEEDCWCLFERRAFGAENEKTEEFVGIGKEIVKKCGGVPLAAKALGGLMKGNYQKMWWSHVRDSQIWELPQDGEGRILSALRLSYNHLPSSCRQCFSFCSVFPKDHEINKEELVHLWMANGFVQPEGRMELEDYGNLIFSELLRRSFFQDVTNDEYGNVKTCKMHDLMHDLACSVSGKECCVMEIGKGTIGDLPRGVRHMLLVFHRGSNVGFNFQSLIKSNPQLRTLLLLGYGKVDISPIILNNLKCLRALDMSDIGIKLLPRKVGKMKHLRYLNLSWNGAMKSLPGSITKLRNLQSLKLRRCDALEVLPKHMSKITSLRHVDIVSSIILKVKLTQMPNGLGQLTQLRTLGLFVLGPGTGSQIKELKGLNHLGGELEIRGLEHVSNTEEAKEANLISKQDLSSLKLVWSDDEGTEARVDGELQEKMIEEGLRPHPNLKKIYIKGYGGATLPTWMASLQYLVEIRLGNCDECESLPPLGRLPLLKDITIFKMPSVKRMGDEFYGPTSDLPVFPSLQKLEIWDMPNLEEWSSPSSSSANENSTQAFFPCLKVLSIWYCPKLKAFPFVPCLQDLDLSVCDDAILGSAVNLNSLRSLSIKRSDSLKSLPAEIENLTSLEMLDISYCKSLKCLPVIGSKGLDNLQRLSVSNCPELLFSIKDFQSLNSLQILTLERLPQLTTLPEGIRYLTMLRSLNIWSCNNMRMLSEELKQLTTLQSLTLHDLPQLPEGIRYLTMLRSLIIWDCNNMRMLSEELKQLTTLQSLYIYNCHPDLHKRCVKDKGDDWHIISHIPKLYNMRESKVGRRIYLDGLSSVSDNFA